MGFTLNNIYTGMSIPKDLVLRLIEATKIPYFIETGTAGGESVAWAKNHFEECWTIELLENREITKIEGVNYIQGNTVDHLPAILENEKLIDKSTPIFFWLDAHYCEPVPNTSGNKECYLLEEIEAIKGRLNSVVMIDDARLFAGPPPWPNDPRDWPRLNEIFSKLNECFPNHYITIVDDFIVSVPPELIWVLDREWRDNYGLRYRSAQQNLKEAVTMTYNAVLNYINS